MPTAERNAIYLTSSELDQHSEYTFQAPGHKKLLEDGRMVFAATAANLRYFQALYPDTPIKDKDGTLERLRRSEPAPINTSTPLLIQPAKPLFRHQTRAVQISVARDFYGFFHEQGTGKSAEIILSACELFLRKKISQALVITTKRGLPQFINEQVPEHQAINTRLIAYQLPITKPLRLNQTSLHLGVTTNGAFQSPRKKSGRRSLPSNKIQSIIEWCKRGATALFIDESQNFKGWTSLRVRNIEEILPFVSHRFLYSGEPKPRDYEDLFPQFYIMNENILGHASQTSFRNEFCIMDGHRENTVKEYKNEERLVSLISPHCEFVALRDCKDMPPQFWEPVSHSKFQPTQEQIDVYNQVKKDFVAIVTKGDNTETPEIVKRVCQHAASRLITLAQVANGWLYGDKASPKEQGELVVLNDERALYTVEEKIGSRKKVIVFCRFHEDLASMSRALMQHSIPFVEFSGRVSDKQLEPNKLQFQKDPNCRVFLATTAMGGTSLNLQVANTEIFFSNNYSWGDYDQAVHRIWRTGQEEPCHYINIVGFGICYSILQNLREKRSFTEKLKTLVQLQSLIQDL